MWECLYRQSKRNIVFNFIWLMLSACCNADRLLVIPGAVFFKWEMEPLVSYVIQDLCRLSCQEQKSIRLELKANPGAERRRTLSLWISHVRFESFLTHSTWQCKRQRRPQCELEPREPAFGRRRWMVKHASARHWDLLLGVKNLILGGSRKTIKMK